MEETGREEALYRFPSPEEISKLPDEQKKKLAKELRALWKALNTHPRSDWHKLGFETILRIEMHPYGDTVQILTEQTLGEEPPRIDYIILVAKEARRMKKGIYRFFRRFNIIEYKNPHDALDERVIRIIIAYANFYIGTAAHKSDVPADEVTISIFRAVKNKELFERMMQAGELEATEEPGVYRVKKLTDLPFQIVITSELVGPEYAKYRVLVDGEHADTEDLKRVLEDGRTETDASMQNYYREFLNFVGQKNPQTFEEVIGVDKAMEDYLMHVLRKRIDQEKAHAVQIATQKNTMVNLYEYVQDGGMTVDFAAKKARQERSAFLANMRRAGFSVPEARV